MVFRLKNNFNVTLGSVLLKQLCNLDLKFKENCTDTYHDVSIFVVDGLKHKKWDISRMGHGFSVK